MRDIDLDYVASVVLHTMETGQNSITVLDLAEMRGVDPCVVRRYLRRKPSMVALLGVRTHTEELYALYCTYAALLRASGKRVTSRHLADVLNRSSIVVKRYMAAHPDLAQMIGWTDR